MLTLKQWPSILALLIGCVLIKTVDSKIYERCELAKILRQHHRLELQEVAQWVCIAQHSSGLNTAAQAYSSAGGSHGLFQISDVYWCSGTGSGCNIPCHKLRDDNLSDDLLCAKRIYDEHQRISGDGYNAWNSYPQYCKNNAASYIQGCFPNEIRGSTHLAPVKGYNSQYAGNSIEDHPAKKLGKIYGKCELARELYHKHKMPMEQVPTWVCIAEHESRFNTAAVGRLNADGSLDHGLFQISDLYWCAHDRYSGGKACGLSCNKLLDEDISDDIRCVKRIHAEHTAISGDGFNAWTVYKPYCQNQQYNKVSTCFSNSLQTSTKVYSNAVGFSNHHSTPQHQSNPFFKHQTSSPSYYQSPKYNDVYKTSASSYSPSRTSSHKGKIYTRCSLAQELYFKYNFPMQDIATWVCIAEHESQLNTAAIGRLNTDGSADHGLFQISDRYWCTHDSYGGKACNMPCDKLLDEDLRDDVRCIQIIHEEHTRISGNGFNAWTVYQPHCTQQNIEHIKQCFDEKDLATNEVQHHNPDNDVKPSKGKGKIYKKCELAQELYHQHQMPMDQIPKWVCIAQHESSFNTAAVGRLNTDGSADHGLFQISDLYWCSHDQYGGKACNIPCDKLLDSDISDDVKCIKIIHEEHTRISGDGFNAWTVYKPHCRNTGMDHIKSCFTEEEYKDTRKTTTSTNTNSLQPHYPQTPSKGNGKIYKKCELAQELYHQHQMPMEQIPKWVCIAQHESSFNTAAVGRLNTDGSADHGLFQISDLYWCTHDQYGGKACNIPCDKLLDSDISDDVRCIKIIHEEHTRISGDGFNAWTVYKPHCRNTGMDHIKSCFTEKELKDTHNTITPTNTNSLQPHYPQTPSKGMGKIYKKCELAQELYHQHQMPMDQIPKWVCIAQHESSFNTAAVGRLNTDGSADHGLFQISDLYWCTHDQFGGKACNIPCVKLLDSDISDDVRCIKIIHEEHTRISGDGFNAWTVYKPHCRNTGMDHIKSCFTEKELKDTHNTITPINTNSLQPHYPQTPPKGKGKIYKKCELAQELLSKHQMPMEQIPTWVCIAQHESSFNTAAVGRLNTDGSADHGLFQISDLYWCTHDQYGGKACNIPCDKLLDSDISDDVRCVKIIHEEHTRISGDGFNAWTVYKPHCRNRKMEEIRSCFTGNEIEDYEKNLIVPAKPVAAKKPVATGQGVYGHNPFLSGFNIKPQAATTQKPFINPDFKISLVNQQQNYANNPFLQNVKTQSQTQKISTQSQNHIPNYNNNPFLKPFKTEVLGSSGQISNNEQNYKNNPFLSNKTKPQVLHNINSPSNYPTEEVTSKPAYNKNPFLNGSYKPGPVNKGQNKPSEAVRVDSFNSNPFLNGNIKISATHEITSKPAYNKNPFLNGNYKPGSVMSGQTKPSEAIRVDSFDANPFLNGNTKFSATEKPTSPSLSYQFNPFLQNLPTPSPTKNYLNSNQFRTTTRKPITSTTLKPTTTWNSVTKQKFSTTTKIPITTTTRKTTTTLKTTTKTPITTSWTTKTPKVATTWNWQKQKYANSTVKPLAIQSTTIKSPKTTTTWSWNSSKYTNPSTTQLLTTKSPKTSTTWNWQNHKYANPTTKPATTKIPKTTTTSWNWQKYANPTTKPTPLSTTTPKSTTARPTTTWNWQNQQYAKPTAKPLTNWSSTTKLPKTTKSATTWNWQNQRYSNTSTTKSPLTTTRLYSTTKRAATTKNWLNQKYTNNTTKTTSFPKTSTNWNSFTTKPQITTTIKPEKTTWNWRNEQKTTTTKTPATATSPTTTTKNWRIYDKTTFAPATTKKTLTTKPTFKTTSNWLSSTLKATTTKPPTTTTKRITTTTKSPTTRTLIQQTLKPTKPSAFVTTKPQNTFAKNQENHKTTTLKPVTTKTTKAQTFRPSTTKSVLQKSTTKSFVTTTLKPFNSTKPSSIGDYEKFKKDPFSHPFFSKVNEEIRRLKGNTTATKLPAFKATQLHSFPDSPYYQDYKNSMGNNTKTIVAYTFNQTVTTKRPRL